MSERPRNEKDEKNEKDNGDSWDEKWRNDPVNAAVLALILIWAGVVWLVSNIDGFPTIGGLEVWSTIMIGAGLIVLLGVLVRLFVPAYRRPVLGYIILGVVLIAIGLGNIISWTLIGPLVLIAIGVGGFLAYFRTRE
jgi:hypothetical protein